MGEVGLNRVGLTIPETLRVQGNRHPDAAAILAPGRQPLTYRALQAQVYRHVDWLTSMGLSRGDRVAVVLPNGPEMAVSFLSVAAVAGCAPLNPEYPREEYEFYLTDLDAKALVLPAGSARAARDVASSLRIPVVDLQLTDGSTAGEFGLTGPLDLGEKRAGMPGPDDIALILHTSGTTSRPKMVPLTHANLIASAENVSRALRLGEADRCLNIMPFFHIHGLVAGLLAPLVSGGSVICTPGFYATDFFAWMQALQPTWYTAVPTMHQAILARAGEGGAVLERVPLRFIRSSSSPLPPQVMASMEQAFGVPVIEAYGMTEASHQMASNPLPPGERKPASVGRAAGPEVAIMDETGRQLLSGETGEIVIRGPNVMSGYLNNPEANARSFVNGWFRTGDLGYLDPDGYLFIVGRIKEIINRGGEKISPREVEEVLLGHPAVSQVAAFAVPDNRLGEDVAAVVVLKPGAAVSSHELRKYAEGRLASYKVPRQVLIQDNIPKGPTGKVQRIGLAQKLGMTGVKPASDGQRVDVAPRTAIEQALAEIWSDVLRVEKVGVHEAFLDLGGDSMLAMMLLVRVRTRLGVDLSIVDFFDASTVAEQARLIEASRLASEDQETRLDFGPRGQT